MGRTQELFDVQSMYSYQSDNLAGGKRLELCLDHDYHSAKLLTHPETNMSRLVCMPACLPACLSVCEGTNISHISLSGISRFSKATIGNQVCGHRHSKSYLSGEQTTRTYVERKEITKKNNLDNDLVDYPKPKKKKKFFLSWEQQEHYWQESHTYYVIIANWF